MELIFEKSIPGHKGYSIPDCDVPTTSIERLIPTKYLRNKPAELPELAEPEIIRHYVRLSQKNYAVDTHFYPLGSCTMKYNPKVNERIARFAGFTGLHPLVDDSLAQGTLQLLYEMEQCLIELFGFDAFTFQPAAGAHGELTALMMVKAYFNDIGERHRTKIIIPHTAHGTNPASAALCGFQVIEIESNGHGNIDFTELKNQLDSTVAGVMITNPNTLGLFEEQILEIAHAVHQVGAVLYGDGANANALLGKTRYGDLGFDMLHLNLHKTFSAPHGGGGPGSGPVGVKLRFAPYLPTPVVIKNNESYSWDYNRPKSIGRIHSFYGNIGVVIKAYAYIRSLGASGLNAVSDQAVLSANYLKKLVEQKIEVPYSRTCMHEFVASGQNILQQTGIKTVDIAKRLLDYGFYAPTVYFPLTVKEALMIEPTETENKATLDAFAAALEKIVQESMDNPELVKSAPQKTPVRRLDEVTAARQPNLKFKIRS
ncbi:MAG: aminomethyl-transferring glycine dehydrogenase subunit GcvPB [bacterium]|nr:aminomethyl-transferring glycine dehydrogenase subunit GcvPB [bacterium]